MATVPLCRIGVDGAVRCSAHQISVVQRLATIGRFQIGSNRTSNARNFWKSQQSKCFMSTSTSRMSDVVKMPHWIAPQKDKSKETVWWSTDGQNHNGESRQELERVLGVSIASEVLGELGEEFFKKPATKREFSETFRKTAFVAVGPAFEGVQFEAEVLSVDNIGLKVDYGGKFPARLRHSGLETARMQVGDRVIMVLHDVERAEHLLGDARNTSVHLALGAFVRAVDGPASTPRE